uniref:OSIGBa0138E08-OSIGBa0161L23.6 protein n=1 Tax=Oryza sativa TaxID=4530 RepID=Q01HM1_ORYSA|nr:OSIGBa0138E08-OSIGBa0161L23.6 [Oryza sativa]
MAGPSVWKGLGVAGSTSIVISDDEKKEIQQDVEDLEEEEERPGWLPDGWIMEVYQGDDGTIYRYYTSPISGLTFTMKSEVLQYLFSGMDERFLESKNCAADNQLINNSVYVSPTMTYMQMTHEWLPKGWIIEVRAGGKNMNKMYKFYVYPPAGVRLFSKEDVLLYINKSEITGFDTNGECDTRTKDNILANVEFNPHSLPEGWVKEVVFRKTKTGVIRKDPYFTDPVNNYSFRTRKSAMLYVQTGKVPKRAFIQRTSVHDLYSFEKSADLHESLKKRLDFAARTNRKSRRSLKSKNSSLTEKSLSDEESSYKYGDSSDDLSDSSSEVKKNKGKLEKTTCKTKKSVSFNTAKRPVGRPSKRSTEEMPRDVEIKQESASSEEYWC